MKSSFFPSQGLGARRSSTMREGSFAKTVTRTGRFRRREARKRLEDQMSRWGLDVTDPSGNLLVRHGFIARKHPNLGGSSVYSRTWHDRRIELHSQWAGIGGGGRPGMIFVRPLGCIRLLPPEVSEVPFGLLPSKVLSRAAGDPESPSAELALSEFLAWLEDYESWAAGLRNHRISHLAGHPGSLSGTGLPPRTADTHKNTDPSSKSR
jgi:hypothetical protein